MGPHTGPGGLQLSSARKVQAPLSAVGVPGQWEPTLSAGAGAACAPPWQLTLWTGSDSPVALHSVHVSSGRGCVCARVHVCAHVCVCEHKCSKLFPFFSPQAAGRGPSGRGTLLQDGPGEGRAGGLPLPRGRLSSQPMSCLLSLIPVGPARVTLPRVRAAGHNPGIPNPQTAH